MTSELKLVHKDTGNITPHEGNLLHHLIKIGAKVNGKRPNLQTQIQPGDEVTHQGQTFTIQKHVSGNASQRPLSPPPRELPSISDPSGDEVIRGVVNDLTRLIEKPKKPPSSPVPIRNPTPPSLPIELPPEPQWATTTPLPTPAGRETLIICPTDMQALVRELSDPKSGLLQVAFNPNPNEVTFQKITGTGPAKLTLPTNQYKHKTRTFGQVHKIKNKLIDAQYLLWNPTVDATLMDDPLLHHVGKPIKNAPRVAPYIASFRPGAWNGDVLKFINAACHIDAGNVTHDAAGNVIVTRLPVKFERQPFEITRDPNDDNYYLHAYNSGIEISNSTKPNKKIKIKEGHRAKLQSGHVINIAGSQFIFTTPQETSFKKSTPHGLIREVIAHVKRTYPKYAERTSTGTAHAKNAREFITHVAQVFENLRLNDQDRQGNTPIHYLENHAVFDPILNQDDIYWNVENKKGESQFHAIFKDQLEPMKPLIAKIKAKGVTRENLLRDVELVLNNNRTGVTSQNEELVREINSLHSNLGQMRGTLGEHRGQILYDEIAKMIEDQYQHKRKSRLGSYLARYW